MYIASQSFIKKMLHYYTYSAAVFTACYVIDQHNQTTFGYLSHAKNSTHFGKLAIE